MTSDPKPTAAEEDYLKAIFGLSEWASGPVTASDLAAELKVANSSVTVMVKKLAARGWVDYRPYSPVTLTEAGYAAALTVVRRHRLLETFLVDKLGYTWEEVHVEADALEHSVSDRFIERIDALLGHPTEDPHGDRIPSAEGVLPATSAVQATRLDEGHPGILERVSDANPQTLRDLTTAGIFPGARVTVSDGGGLLSEDGAVVPGVDQDVWLRPAAHDGCSLPAGPSAPEDSRTSR